MTNTIHMLPSATEGQMMSIILTTAEGGLILIDGGRREDAAPLLDYLKNLTGSAKPHIDAIQDICRRSRFQGLLHR